MGRRGARLRFVIDNSVVAAWLLAEANPVADAILGGMAAHEPLAPALWPLELANVLVVAERRGRLSAADLIRFRDDVQALGIRIVPEPPGRVLGDVLDLARAEGLTSYDAAYLDLAIRERAPLATVDRRLRDAALRRGIGLFEG